MKLIIHFSNSEHNTRGDIQSLFVASNVILSSSVLCLRKQLTRYKHVRRNGSKREITVCEINKGVQI